VIFLLKTPEFNPKPQLMKIIQNNWPAVYKSDKVMENKERLKETKDTWELRVIHDSKLDLLVHRDYWKNLNGVWELHGSNVSVLAPDLDGHRLAMQKNILISTKYPLLHSRKMGLLVSNLVSDKKFLILYLQFFCKYVGVPNFFFKRQKSKF
jgi:hypothetical protein